MDLTLKHLNRDSSIDSKYLFIHGGPGLNSFAEKTILGSLFSNRNISITFWNEPSKFRPTSHLNPHDNGKASQGAFSRLLDSAEAALIELAQSGPVRLIGHSFGCNTAVILASRNPDLVVELNLIAPAFDQLEAHRNIMRIAIEDFKVTSPDLALKLNHLIASSQAPFDAAIREGLSLAFQDAALLSHYWKNKDRLMESLKCLASPEAQVDFDAFFKVTEDFTNHYLPKLLDKKLQVPTRVFFGEEDPVSSEMHEKQILPQLFHNLSIYKILNTRHYIQLDEPEIFVKQLLD